MEIVVKNYFIILGSGYGCESFIYILVIAYFSFYSFN